MFSLPGACFPLLDATSASLLHLALLTVCLRADINISPKKYWHGVFPSLAPSHEAPLLNLVAEPPQDPPNPCENQCFGPEPGNLFLFSCYPITITSGFPLKKRFLFARGDLFPGIFFANRQSPNAGSKKKIPIANQRKSF